MSTGAGKEFQEEVGVFGLERTESSGHDPYRAVTLGGRPCEPSDLRVSQDNRDKVLLEAPQVNGDAPEFVRLLEVPTRSQGVVEALRKLDRRCLADILAHTDDDLDVSADHLRLDLGETGVEDDAPDVIRKLLEKPCQRITRDDQQSALTIDEG